MNDWFSAECLDHASLRRWLADPRRHLRGIDCGRFARRLDNETMCLPEYL